MSRGLAIPLIAGLAAGIALIFLFGFYSSNTLISSPQNTIRLESYNLTIESKSYLVQYHFGDKQARVLNMTLSLTHQAIIVNVQVHNATSLDMYFPNATLTAAFGSACSGCPLTNNDFPVAVFVDDIDSQLIWNHTRTEAIVRVPLESDSEVVELRERIWANGIQKHRSAKGNSYS